MKSFLLRTEVLFILYWLCIRFVLKNRMYIIIGLIYFSKFSMDNVFRFDSPIITIIIILPHAA